MTFPSYTCVTEPRAFERAVSLCAGLLEDEVTNVRWQGLYC